MDLAGPHRNSLTAASQTRANTRSRPRGRCNHSSHRAADQTRPAHRSSPCPREPAGRPPVLGLSHPRRRNHVVAWPPGRGRPRRSRGVPRTRQPSLRSRNSCRPRRSTRPRPSCLRRGGAIAGQPRSAGCDVPAPSPVRLNGPRASVPRPTEPRHGRGDVLGRATARRHDRSTYAPVLDHLSWSLSWRHDGVSAPPRRRAGGLDGRVGPDFRRRVRARPRRRAVCDDHGNEAALGGASGVRTSCSAWDSPSAHAACSRAVRADARSEPVLRARGSPGPRRPRCVGRTAPSCGWTACHAAHRSSSRLV